MRARTGGPWQQKHDFDREGMLTIIGNVDGEYVDGVPECTYTTICEVDDNEDGMGNARLITAAPDLLAALARATSQIAIWRSMNGDMVGALEEIEDECRAAIAKATGAQ